MTRSEHFHRIYSDRSDLPRALRALQALVLSAGMLLAAQTVAAQRGRSKATEELVSLIRAALRVAPIDSFANAFGREDKARPVILQATITLGPEPQIFKSMENVPSFDVSRAEIPRPSQSNRCCAAVTRLRDADEQYGRDSIWLFAATTIAKSRKIAHVVLSILYGGGEVAQGMSVYFVRRGDRWVVQRRSVDGI